MGLTIILSKPHLRTWFTSLDQIYGTLVFINNKPVNVANIVVYIEGLELSWLFFISDEIDKGGRVSSHVCQI